MGSAVLDNEENARLCLCPACPTYKKSELSNNLFCARGKASEKVSAVGCDCPRCPVAKNYGLRQTYYCIIGKSEKKIATRWLLVTHSGY